MVMALSIKRPPFVPFYVPTHGITDWDTFVFHTTEGKGTVYDYQAFFRGTADQLGVTWCVDQDARIGFNDNASLKTYHVRGGNSYCRGCEIVGTASQSVRDWFANIKRLWALTWLAAWASEAYDLPLAKSFTRGRRLRERGFAGHVDIPTNDHTDPGENFPWGYVFNKAAKWKKNGGPPRYIQLILERASKKTP
jgi:hypothetical protein